MSAPIAKPRSTEQATELLARFSAIAGELATIEANRQTAIAATDAVADSLAAPLAAEQAQLAAVLEPWWAKAGPALTGGKRKSVDLGGCNIGTRAVAARVEFTGGDDKAALAVLEKSKHRAAATTLKRVLDRTAIGKLIDGGSAAGAALRALGFHRAGGGEAFFIKRIDSPEAKATAK